MELGAIIRKLRTKEEITQEKLANYLNVSFQAVSKWENGTAYPDIRLLIPISNYFNVSVDYLLDNDKTEENEEVNDIVEKVHKNANKGKVRDNIEILRDALKKYPRNFKIMDILAGSLFVLPENFRQDNKNEILLEIVKLARRVFEDSNDSDLKKSSVFLLISTYMDLGEKEEAIKIANQQSDIYTTQEALLTKILLKEKGQEHIQQYLYYLMDHMTMLMKSLTYPKYDGDKYSNEERIEILKKVLDIYGVMIGEVNPLFFHHRYTDCHAYIARLYAREFDVDKTLYHLEKAKYHSIEADNLSDGIITYDSILFRKIKHSAKWNTKNVEESSVEEFGTYLEREEFDFCRSEDRFKSLK